MKYMLVMSYDGSKFYGFQRQKDKISIQGTIEEYLSIFYNERIVIKGAGRTDRGVHSKYQVAHFVTDKGTKGLKKYLNNNLRNIKIKKIKKVSDDFHARHSALSKVYLYKIDLKGNKDKNYYTYINKKLDINKMRTLSKLLIGTHNFHNFTSGFRENYITTIESIKIYKFNNVLYLKFKGSAFYKYMVRHLVATLLLVGQNKLNKEDILLMLQSDYQKEISPISPNGLYLIKINY